MIDEQRLYMLDVPKENIIPNDYERQQLKMFETNLLDTIDRCENKEIKQVWYKKFNWLQLNVNRFFTYLRLKDYVSKKKINIEELKRETLKNILSSKGIIYRHYLRFLQQKHQSNRYYLPNVQTK